MNSTFPRQRSLVEFVEHVSEGEDVDLVVVGFLLEEFGGHVRGGAPELVEALVGALLQSGESEVAEFETVSVVEEDVVGLDVAVDVARKVDVEEGLGELSGDGEALFLLEGRLTLVQHLVESQGHVLRQNAQGLRRRHDPHDLDDVRVTQHRQRLDLRGHLVQQVVRHVGVEDLLDRHVGALVDSLVDYAEAALADDFLGDQLGRVDFQTAGQIGVESERVGGQVDARDGSAQHRRLAGLQFHDLLFQLLHPVQHCEVTWNSFGHLDRDRHASKDRSQRMVQPSIALVLFLEQHVELVGKRVAVQVELHQGESLYLGGQRLDLVIGEVQDAQVFQFT